jgi:uncharacterized membrane protein (TIGR02234 family)
MKLTLRNLVAIELAFSAIVLLTISRTWVSATYSETGFPSVDLTLSANQLTSSLHGLALAAIASALGAIATRGVFRRIVGAVIAALGAGIVFNAFNLISDLDKLVGLQFEVAIGRSVSGWVSETASYEWIVVLAGGFIALCGLAITVKSFDSGMSKRYERNPSPTNQLTPWQAMDQGIDPTIQSPTGQQLD